MEQEPNPNEKNPAYIERAKTHNHVPWCDEYEKLISGIRSHTIGVPILEAHLLRTLRLCKAYNDQDIPEDATVSTLMARSHDLIADIVGHIGKHSYVMAPITATFGCNLWIGDRVGINGHFHIGDVALVTIRDRAMIGPRCFIATVNHSLNHLDRRRPDGIARPVDIGEDTWFGAGVTVLCGVTIGKGAVVAAGAVVNKDVAPFTLVGGVPAKFIRKLEMEEEETAKRGKGGDGRGDADDVGVNAVDGVAGLQNMEMESGTSEDDLPRWLQAPRK